MKLYLQNMLFLLPIFSFAILVMGGHKYVANWHELLWRRDRIVDSYAVSIAECLTPQSIADLKTGRKRPFGVYHALQRITESNRIRRLAIFEPKSLEPLYQWGEPPAIQEQEFLRAHLDWFVQRVRSEWQYVPEETHSCFQQADVVVDDDLVSVMVAATPVNDGLGGLNAIVMVETDVSGLQTVSRNILFELNEIAFWVLLIAAVSSLGLSRYVGRSIRDLTRAILDVQKGGLDTIEILSKIREINHLENTYNTMIDVLVEVQERDRDDLIRLDNASTLSSLIDVYGRFLWPLSECRQGPLNGLAALDSAAKGNFIDLCETENGLCGIVGQAEGDGFDAVLSASGVVALWRSQLQNHDPQTAFHKVLDTLHVRWAKCCWVKSGTIPKVNIWSKEPESSEIQTSQSELPAGRSLILHSFRDENAEIAEMVVRRFGRLNPQNLLERLKSVLEEQSRGAVIIIQNSE